MKAHEEVPREHSVTWRTVTHKGKNLKGSREQSQREMGIYEAQKNRTWQLLETMRQGTKPGYSRQYGWCLEGKLESGKRGSHGEHNVLWCLLSKDNRVLLIFWCPNAEWPYWHEEGMRRLLQKCTEGCGWRGPRTGSVGIDVGYRLSWEEKQGKAQVSEDFCHYLLRLLRQGNKVISPTHTKSKVNSIFIHSMGCSKSWSFHSHFFSTWGKDCFMVLVYGQETNL